MKVIYNKIIPFKGFSAINLFGVLFVRRECAVSERMIRHEAIHTAQMRELGYVLFYLLYFFEWLYRLTQGGNAYRSISFEREAFAYQFDRNYLFTRKRFAQWRKK